MTETQPEKRLIGPARAAAYGQTLDSRLEQFRAAEDTQSVRARAEGQTLVIRAARRGDAQNSAYTRR